MGKRPSVTAQTKGNFLEAFWTLYEKNGMEGLTVKEVCALAGYNRATFYEYFPDLGSCLAAVEEDCLQRLTALPPPGGAGADLPPPGIVEAFLEATEGNLRFYRSLLGERGDPAFRRRLIDGIKALFRSALATHPEPGSRADMELEYSLEYHLSGMVAVMAHYLKNKGKRGLPSTLREDFHVIYSAVQSPLETRLGEGGGADRRKDPQAAGRMSRGTKKTPRLR